MAQLPTGGSSLYLGDFAKPLYGITQNLTSAMIDQYEKRKQEGDRDKAALLKALSFEAIENASDKASKMLLDEYGAVEDKWTKRYYDNGLRLSDADYFELERDKRALDQKRATMKGNVEKAMLAQDLLTKYPDRFSKQSYEEFSKFAKEGKIGLEDPIGILKEKFDIVKDFNATFGKFATDPSNEEDVVLGYDYDRKVKKTMKTNIPYIESQLLPAAEQRYKPYFDNPYDGADYRREFDALLNASRIQNRVDEKPLSAAEIALYEKSKMTPSESDFYKKYGIKDPTGNIEYFSRFYHGLLRQDESTINAIVGQQAPDGGKITRVETYPDKITIVSEKMVGTGANRKAEETSVDIETPDWSDAGDVRNKIAEVAKYMPAGLKGNRQIEMGSIPTNYEGNYKPAEYTSIKDIESQLSFKPKEELTVGGEDINAYSPAHRDVIVGQIQNLIPDADVSTESLGWFNPKRGTLPIYWTIDGEKKTFDLNKDKDRADLIKEIKKRAGRKEDIKIDDPLNILD